MLTLFRLIRKDASAGSRYLISFISFFSYLLLKPFFRLIRLFRSCVSAHEGWRFYWNKGGGTKGLIPISP